MSRFRWVVKKAARQGMALGSWASGSLTARSVLQRRPRVRALTYHRIGYESQEAFCVTPEDFEAQIGSLAERGVAVTLDQVEAFVAGREALPDGACLVTIDDGCVSTMTEALPILKRHGVTAVAYVTASLVGSDIRELPERYLDWDELREVADTGVIEIGSHAYTHRSLGLMPADEARDEAQRSKDLLEEHLQREVRTFAYPFGTRTDFGPVTERALADAGYRIAFNSMHGTIKSGMDPISLPRVKVEGGEGLWMFRLLSRGAMDPWRAVDQTLWRLQRERTEIS
ncbi:MAG: polysaccharide deacetylase family protein [Myxococcota bacterium]|nr:polysaccharide deacetylase family protein [Myxococcota bacterium]